MRGEWTIFTILLLFRSYFVLGIDTTKRPSAFSTARASACCIQSTANMKKYLKMLRVYR